MELKLKSNQDSGIRQGGFVLIINGKKTFQNILLGITAVPSDTKSNKLFMEIKLNCNQEKVQMLA